ncbi:MAG: hypothetical protein C3F17_02295 [Bradyrhizobiaceae bacterium]|nr:MAG: hypothetical protein C3F17_02295 [Bradyrhizobiaceae bacterium]
MSDTGLSRRSMLGSIGAGAGLMGAIGPSTAQAALLPEPKASAAFDVVVIGTGMAGCAAALEAVGRGAKVAVLEKAEENRAGGNSAYAAGIFGMPRDDSQESRKMFLEDFVAKAQGRGNAKLYAVLAANARADLAWLRQNGVQFMPTEGTMPPYRIATVTTAPGTFMGMPRQLKAMRDRIVEKGGVIVFGTKARQLLMDDRGAVAGVRALGADGVVDYKSRSVVIAAGGYAGNKQILEAYSDPNAGALMVRGIDWATGDGLLMAQDAGAGLRGLGGVMALHISAVDPVETSAGNPFAAQPFCLSINREGRRFMDESKGYVAHGKAVLNQPGQSVALVFDETIKSLPGPSTNYATFQRLGLKVAEAETLEQLAKLIGVPVEPFLETVRSFNAAVKNDSAMDAKPPKQQLAYRIEKPKFYAFHPLVPGVTLTFGGIMINESAQVLEADGRIIRGLYAAGEGAGHAFFDDYIGGSALTNCLVMGRIAGRNATS